MQTTRRRRIVYICDWLPPDYGAVGQYSDLFARQMAADGADVILGGLTTGRESEVTETVGFGSLTTVKLAAESYEKSRFLRRMMWTSRINTRLVLRLWRHMRHADEILFTGSPPLMLHWIAPANLILRKRLIYRITDFHPECLMATMRRPSLPIRALYRLTLFWRRQVDEFEVLGEDQRARLVEIGIPRDRTRLKRDPSPVEIAPGTERLPCLQSFPDKLLLLYSGNWGVAHDTDTFLAAYRQHHSRGSGRFVLWLNAVGVNASKMEAVLATEGLPLIRGKPVALSDLARLLVTPAAHLITLSDAFVGFVLPSKVYGCVASGRPILFVGSDRSDVHLLCSESRISYRRVDVGDSAGCAAALEDLADVVAHESSSGVLPQRAEAPGSLS